MDLNLETLDSIPAGEIFRKVTTKILNNCILTEHTFLCKKGDGGHDWAIYYSLSPHTDRFICDHGEKLRQKDSILEICPCTPEVLARYRQ